MNDLLSRKGASKPENIPEKVLIQLNKGAIESVNLTEWLAVNHIQLIENVLSPYPDYLQECAERFIPLSSMGVRTCILEISKILLAAATKKGDAQLFKFLATHRSDSVRCWAVYMVGANIYPAIQAKLEAIKPFAADRHFGVRELAWMAVREDVAVNLAESIKILLNWTASADENIRRFAIELTRPRGVWCKHITILKENPGIAIRLLEALKADPSTYVQHSVGNWLNDAGKTQPDWVLQLCKSWTQSNPDSNTLKIVKRATRSIQF